MCNSCMRKTIEPGCHIFKQVRSYSVVYCCVYIKQWSSSMSLSIDTFSCLLVHWLRSSFLMLPTFLIFIQLRSQGDPPEDLFVVVEGTVNIIKELVIVSKNRCMGDVVCCVLFLCD